MQKMAHRTANIGKMRGDEKLPKMTTMPRLQAMQNTLFGSKKLANIGKMRAF